MGVGSRPLDLWQRLLALPLCLSLIRLQLGRLRLLVSGKMRAVLLHPVGVELSFAALLLQVLSD